MIDFIKQMWIDPSTNQASGTRFITWWVAVIILPFALLLHAFVRDLGSAWTAITTIGGVSGVGYAGNSFARVWKSKAVVKESTATVSTTEEAVG
jgi:hypothetical protein